MLLSYHDNDHYNSVRLTRPAKHTAPIRTFVKSDWKSSWKEKEGGQEYSQEYSVDVDVPDEAVEETKVRGDSDDEAVGGENPLTRKEPPRKSQEKKTPLCPTRQLTRNAKCPCNSGLKYKKCCYAKERLDLKVADTALGSDGLARDVDNDVDGQFRILLI